MNTEGNVWDKLTEVKNQMTLMWFFLEVVFARAG